MSTPNTRRIFKAVVTITGLVIAACGLVLAIGALAQAFNPPTYAELLGRVELPQSVWLLLHGKHLEGSVLMKQIVFTFMVKGFVPMLLGLVLVRFGGFFQRSTEVDSVSPLRRLILPRMSLALARIEEDIERGYQPFRL